jgi:hypothetical protein
MTLRNAGAAAIRLLGLYFASRVVALYFALMLTPYLISPAAFSTSDPALATSVSSAVGSLAVALIAIFGADRIAAWLFPATPIVVGLSRHDLLRVGIALLGLWMCLDAVTALLRAAGALAFYWQLQVPAASLERSWPQALANIFTLVTGAAVARSARALAAKLDRSSVP